MVLLVVASSVENLPEKSLLASQPKIRGENLSKNKPVCDRIEILARKHHRSPAQVAPAGVLQQGDDVVPIPGTTKIENLDGKIGAMRVNLTEEDLEELCDAVPIEGVAGDRIYEHVNHVN